MQEFMSAYFAMQDSFLNSGSFLVYLFIFFGKVLEVSLGTLRIVLINRGERVKGGILAFVEICLWLIIASSVIAGYKEDVGKALAYALAYACGNFAGSWLDERLAFGLSSVQVLLSNLEDMNRLRDFLSAQGFGVTAMEVSGRDESTRYMLLVIIKRKLLKETLENVNRLCPKAMVTVSDVKTVKGGYMRAVPKRGGAAK